MALIDEFLYGLGFNADLRGGQAFDEQLKRIGDHGESTCHSLLSTITAANLLSHALEKGAEMAKEAFLSLKNNGVEPTAAEMKVMGDTMAAATCWIKT